MSIIGKLEIIKNNLFINDMNWEERAMENKKLAEEIKEEIKNKNIITYEARKILDFLEYHNLINN